MLNSEELAQLRAMQEEAMPETVQVYRITLADDGHGGSTETRTLVTTTTGRQAATGRSPQEQLIAQRAAGQNTTNWNMPAGTDVLEADELVSDGRTYKVLGILRRSYETARRTVCVEVT